MQRVYLDYNATTPVDLKVREAMMPFLGETFGNPSSLHASGARARKALDEAREQVAQSLSCRSEEIVFTSGGTEAINLAIRGVVNKIGSSIPHLITSVVEHKSVLETVEALEAEGRVEVTRLSVDSEGNIDLEKLKAAIRENTRLISLMWVNNEIGNIYPIREIGAVARERKILFHVDAVQALGKIPIELSKLPVDLASFSAHKIYGPKGVGALYVRKGVEIRPILHGGAQEMEKRGGTENLPGIVGFGAACHPIREHIDSSAIAGLRDLLENQLVARIPGTKIQGNRQSRVANTVQMTFERVTSEAILIALDREGIEVSSGSACASGAVEPSHVLLAMGVSRAEAKGAVRFSLGRYTTKADIDYVLERVPMVIERVRG